MLEQFSILALSIQLKVYAISDSSGDIFGSETVCKWFNRSVDIRLDIFRFTNKDRLHAFS